MRSEFTYRFLKWVKTINLKYDRMDSNWRFVIFLVIVFPVIILMNGISWFGIEFWWIPFVGFIIAGLYILMRHWHLHWSQEMNDII